MATRNLDLALRIKADLNSAQSSVESLTEAIHDSGETAEQTGAALDQAFDKLGAGGIQLVEQKIDALAQALDTLHTSGVASAEGLARAQSGLNTEITRTTGAVHGLEQKIDPKNSSYPGAASDGGGVGRTIRPTIRWQM